MNEEIRDPREDISYIKNILARTADGMKSVAPWFTRLGVVWLLYGLWSVLYRLVLVYTASGPYHNVNAAVSWVFYLVLAAGFFLARRHQTRRGINTLALKLVDVWGACILLFLALSVGFEVAVPFAAARILLFSVESTNQLSMACSIGESCLLFVLPLLPLIITAIFLENRRMLWAGIVLTALAALIVGSHILLIWASESILPAAISGWKAAACLLDIIPGVMLLLFARDLKRG